MKMIAKPEVFNIGSIAIHFGKLKNKGEKATEISGIIKHLMDNLKFLYTTNEELTTLQEFIPTGTKLTWPIEDVAVVSPAAAASAASPANASGVQVTSNVFFKKFEDYRAELAKQLDNTLNSYNNKLGSGLRLELQEHAAEDATLNEVKQISENILKIVDDRIKKTHLLTEAIASAIPQIQEYQRNKLGRAQ